VSLCAEDLKHLKEMMVAVKISIQIMDAFVVMRKLLSANTGIIQRLENVEQKQIIRICFDNV